MSKNKLKSGAHQFIIEHEKDLLQFFYVAQVKYSSGEITPFPTPDGGLTILYEEGDWKYSDLWYGGEPYSGITRIYYQGKICFCLTYGGMIKPYARREPVMAVLMEALQHARPLRPWRGPRRYNNGGGLYYRNNWEGCSRDFKGHEEIIHHKGINSQTQVVYECDYRGLVVNTDGDPILS